MRYNYEPILEYFKMAQAMSYKTFPYIQFSAFTELYQTDTQIKHVIA